MSPLEIRDCTKNLAGHIIGPMNRSATSFNPCGLITLTTDFGLQDPFAGIMKGVIKRHFGDASVVDLCHAVPPFRGEIAGLWLGLCHHWFPEGTVHVAVVDPGVGTDRNIVCIQARCHAFIAPDNGLAAELVSHLDSWTAWRLDPEALDLDIASTTFHGRDIFAPVAAMLASASAAPDSLGSPDPELVPSALPRPIRKDASLTGEILFADHFGNLSTNIPGPLPKEWNDATVSVEAQTARLVRAYGEARPGETVAIFNSFGLLEIALPRASARDRRQWGPGTPVRVSKTG